MRLSLKPNIKLTGKSVYFKSGYWDAKRGNRYDPPHRLLSNAEHKQAEYDAGWEAGGKL